MENTSYALYIAVGTLVAIVILSILLMRWRQIGFFENTKDDAVATKNRAAFNAEYEAYNKSLMYGTDVLSCLNKAQNNNQKYVYNNYFGTDTANVGNEQREEFFIDVEVKINSTLSDSVKAYYKDRTGKYKRIVGLVDTYKSNYSSKVFNGSGFNIPKINYYYFNKGLLYQESKPYTEIMWKNASGISLYQILTKGVKYGGGDGSSGLVETKMAAGTYHLLTSEDTSTITSKDETAKLAALISTVNLKEQQLDNPIHTPSSNDESDWWYCTWTTAASDFKSRKFKCTGVEYSESTGYISKIKFEEVNK